MKILHLTLTPIPFILMLKGVKTDEFRRRSEWITARLVGKDYTHVKFVNGYGADKPWFIAEYKGYDEEQKMDAEYRYQAGKLFMNIYPMTGDYIIHLGGVTDSGNLDKLK